MIVKIKYKDSWVFYDNLTKVRYEPISVADSVSLETDADWLETLSKPRQAALLFTRKEDGTEFVISANNTVYLLNNDGKTIEKLN